MGSMGPHGPIEGAQVKLDAAACIFLRHHVLSSHKLCDDIMFMGPLDCE